MHAIILLMTIWSLSINQVSAVAGQGPVLIELFTSQSCSSCPPADEYITELAKRDDVIPLSFHVDYWNYLSWVDKFSSSANTQRQRNYAQALKLRSLYTPQAVINGRFQTTGSKRKQIEELIKLAKQKQNPIEITSKDLGKEIEISIGTKANTGKLDILLISYDSQQTTKVTAGENRGRTLTSTNIVKEVAKLGTWDGKKKIIKITKAANQVLILQEQNQGEVIATYTSLF